MFTGLVEATGRVLSCERSDEGARLIVDAPFAGELEAGESVAVDGCCLTQLPGRSADFAADLSLETLACTSLDQLEAGAPVHLERAMRLDGRLGGHLVQGHVDGVETLLSAESEGEGLRQRFSLREADAAFVVPKGSITVNGVSLTVAALGPGWFEVALVPHTLEVTALGELAAGRRVNVEHDLVGKYLLRALGLSGRVDLPPEARSRLGLD
jgi:riboflavin synthase